jgi:hypothetical protein
MRFLIIGDVHCCWSEMSQHIHNNVLGRGFEFDAIIQVGDLGYYKQPMAHFLNYINKINKPFHFIDGNHESHDLLMATYKNFEKHNVFYHVRGDITVLPDGTKIGWFGGACNVDRPQEMYGNGLYNYALNSDAVEFAQRVNAIGGVDLMITHAAPHSIGVGMVGSEVFIPSIAEFIHKRGLTTGPIWDCGEECLTTLWNNLKVKPKQQIYGHYHRTHHAVVGTTHFHCVGSCDYIKPAPAIYFYDSTTKSILK